nr:hypothetical protein BJQ95_00901 [Cryobacterium sp. SO1]
MRQCESRKNVVLATAWMALVQDEFRMPSDQFGTYPPALGENETLSRLIFSSLPFPFFFFFFRSVRGYF